MKDNCSISYINETFLFVRHVDAINLGVEYYNDSTKALVGLKGPKEAKKKAVVVKMTEVLSGYLTNCVMTKHFPQEGNSTVLREYFERGEDTSFHCTK